MYASNVNKQSRPAQVCAIHGLDITSRFSILQWSSCDNHHYYFSKEGPQKDKKAKKERLTDSPGRMKKSRHLKIVDSCVATHYWERKKGPPPCHAGLILVEN